MNTRSVFLTFLLLTLVTTSGMAQLRRPGFITVEREDRSESQLSKEKGAIYLEGMVADEVVVRVSKSAPTYSTLAGDRWLGNLLANQNAVLLAVSEKAYRVRAKAKQGQIAGWVSKAAVEGLPADFEENLREFHERYEIVRELIESHQVALGMSVEEVIASIGPPDRRSSKITQEGRNDSLEYISYKRVPQSFVSYDSFGVPFTTTRHIEVEAGRVQVEFVNDTVTSIEESEGVSLSDNGAWSVVPPPIFLF